MMALLDVVWLHASIVSRRIAPAYKISKITSGISKIPAIVPLSFNAARSSSSLINQKLTIFNDLLYKFKNHPTDNVSLPTKKGLIDYFQKGINYYNEIKNPTVQDNEKFIKFLDHIIDGAKGFYDLERENDILEPVFQHITQKNITEIPLLKGSIDLLGNNAQGVYFFTGDPCVAVSRYFYNNAPAYQIFALYHEFRHHQQRVSNSNRSKLTTLEPAEKKLYHVDTIKAFEENKHLKNWKHWEHDADYWTAKQIKCPTCLKVAQAYRGLSDKTGYFNFKDFQPFIDAAKFNSKCFAHSLEFDTNTYNVNEHNYYLNELEGRLRKIKEVFDSLSDKEDPFFDNFLKHNALALEYFDKKCGNIFLHLPQLTFNIVEAIKYHQKLYAKIFINEEKRLGKNALVSYDAKFAESQIKNAQAKKAEEKKTTNQKLGAVVALAGGLTVKAINDIKNAEYLEEEAIKAIKFYNEAIEELEKEKQNLKFLQKRQFFLEEIQTIENITPLSIFIKPQKEIFFTEKITKITETINDLHQKIIDLEALLPKLFIETLA